MKTSTNPLFAIVIGVVLVWAGYVMTSSASSVGPLFGWTFIVLGSLSVIVNVVLYFVTRR